jgi:Flp pilus assembly protein TadD
VESGRSDPLTGLTTPWPWTIQTRGHGHVYETSSEAVGEAMTFLKAGSGFVDVGCLQVDLFHHPDAFRTLEAAFDPATNIDYAVRYLSGLAHSRGSWLEAVAAYNAGNPADGVEYLAKVLYLWKGVHLTAQAAQASRQDPRRVGFLIETPPMPFDLAADLFARHDYAAALTIYNEQLRHHPDDVTALIGAANALAAEGHEDAARNRLELALLVVPDNHLVQDELLRLIDDLPADRKLAALMTARQAAPAAADLPARIALLQAEAGQLDDAVVTMGEAVTLRPDDPIRLLDYALLLDRTGRKAAARDAYRTFFNAYRPGRSPALSLSLDQVRQRLAYLETALQQP